MTLHEEENIQFESLIDSFAFDCRIINRDMIYTDITLKAIY